MIDEKKLILHLNDWMLQESFLRHMKNPADTIAECIKAIEEQPKTDMWIPCSERLPEDGFYLCTLDGELCGQEEPFTGMCGIENGVWDEPDCVIAWQPLPEPYRG